MPDDEGILEPSDEELLELEEWELEDDEELAAFLKTHGETEDDIDYLSIIGAEFDNPEEMDE